MIALIDQIVYLLNHDTEQVIWQVMEYLSKALIVAESLCLFLSNIFVNNSYLIVLYTLRSYLLICLAANSTFLADVSLCV